MTPTVDIRPMAFADVDAAEVVWQEAFADMRTRGGFPDRPSDDEKVERIRRRLRYFLSSDPAGSWVATWDDEVVGVAQALRRSPLWVLSLLGVAVRAQGRGLGRQLLDRALTYAEPDGAALILSSSDSRAMHRYVAAGFSLHPVVAALGRVRRDRLPAVHGVREASMDDVALTAEVDEQVRGAARRRDIAHLLDDGARMLLVEGRGYAIARGSQPVTLSAVDEAAARSLLAATLAGGPSDQHVEVGWLGDGQQWAIDLVVAAGLELRLSGAIMVRGLNRPPRPYIANGAFG